MTVNFSALARPGARRRWSVVAGAGAVLCALPALVAAIPVHVRTDPATTLLARIKASTNVQFTGYAESVGRLNLPDVGQFGDVLDLLGGTSQLRIWWDTPTHYRVDAISAGGEKDIHVDGQRRWTWDSSRRQATLQRGAASVPVPASDDVTPPALVRRLLAEIPADRVQPGPARRIAGKAAQGIVVTPDDKNSLVGHVKIWADPTTGLPLRAEITARGGRIPTFSSSFVDLHLGAPKAQDVDFQPRQDPTARFQFEGRRDGRTERSAYLLPQTAGGLTLRSDPHDLIVTYGKGLTLVAVVPVSEQLAQAVEQKVDTPSRPPVSEPYGVASLVATPLVSGLATAEGGRGYLMAGDVPVTVLENVAEDLAENPPPFAEGPQR